MNLMYETDRIEKITFCRELITYCPDPWHSGFKYPYAIIHFNDGSTKNINLLDLNKKLMEIIEENDTKYF